jgi:hypothetical protein
VDGDDARIWKVAAAARAEAEAVGGVGVPTDSGGVRKPRWVGVMGDAIPQVLRRSWPRGSEAAGVVG